MEGGDGFDDDEPFIFRLNDSGSGPGLLVKVSRITFKEIISFLDELCTVGNDLALSYYVVNNY